VASFPQAVGNSSTARASSSFAAWYAMGVLMLATLFSFIDRYIFNLLLPQIEHDLHLSDTKASLLQGVAFGIFYSVMAVPFGLLVDRTNRRNLVAVGITLWTVATILCGMSSSFSQLLAARVGVGVGEAVLMPAAMSIIVDLFPAERRGRALGIFTTAVFIGGGGSSLVGGAVLAGFGARHLVVLPLFGAIAVWKAAFITVASPGLLVALLALTFREPPRQITPQMLEARHSKSSILAYMRQHPAPFYYVLGSHTIFTFVSFAFFPWVPTLFIRSYHVTGAQAGFAVGLGTLGMGIVGSLIAGWLGDRWTRQNRVGAKFRLTLLWWIGMVPTTILTVLSGNLVLAAVFFAIYHMFNCFAYASASATMQDMVPDDLRGRTAAMWFLVTGVIGQGFGPLSTALVTDRIFHNQMDLRYSIIVVMVPSAIAGLLITWFGLRPYDRLRLWQRAAANR